MPMSTKVDKSMCLAYSLILTASDAQHEDREPALLENVS